MKTTLTKTTTREKALHSDATSDDLVFVSKQNVRPVIDEAKQLAEKPMDKDFKPVAVIPDIIVEQMMRDGSWGDPAAMKRWLNDPQNKCFRVWGGRV